MCNPQTQTCLQMFYIFLQLLRPMIILSGTKRKQIAWKVCRNFKKKLENTDPSHFKKLQKLLALISSPKKKVRLNALLQCENMYEEMNS